MPNVRVFCGGAAVHGKQRSTDLVLDVAARQSELAHVTLKLQEITGKMLTELPHRSADLLEIATYVYCADQFTKREPETMPGMGVGWHRSFQFFIGVRDPAFWSSAPVVDKLTAMLGFLSDDTFRFEFSDPQRRDGAQAYLKLAADGPPSAFVPDEVILFSGGLDSFAGALDAVVRRGAKVALVSHRASPMIASKQTELVRAIRGHAGDGRLLHVTVGVTKGKHRAVEFTQRTRSFLFAALGFVVANLFGRRQVSFYENGVVSLNLPLADHVLGTRATRTTHPRVLKEFNNLFSRVAAQDVRVENPFFWKTKADVVRSIADLGCGELIPATFSCARVREATKQSGRHCGVCSQCLDRRFGVLAADCGRFEPEHIYSVDLFRGARNPGLDAIMAESYVLAAHRYAGSTEAAFLGAHAEVLRAVRFLDMPAAEALTRVYALHVRHGQAVKAVLSRQVETTDLIASRLTLPDSSLLAMVLSPQAQSITYQDPAEFEPPAAQQASQRPIRTFSRPISISISANGDRVVFGNGPVLQGPSAKLVWTLMPSFQAGLTAARGADGHAYTMADKLAGELGITTASLRQRVRRLRTELRDQFLAHAGVTIEDDDVIQNAPWKGYRISPHLSLSSLLVNKPAILSAAE